MKPLLSIIGVAAAGLALAVPSALLSGYDPSRQRVVLVPALVSAGSAVAVAMCVWLSRWRQRRTWIVLVVAWGVAALMPVASDSSRDVTCSGLALGLMAVAALLLDRNTRTSRFGAGLAAVAACWLEATALILPVACFITALRRPAGARNHASLLLIAAIAAATIGFSRTGGSVFIGLAGHAAARDIVLLLPLLALGLAGYCVLADDSPEPDWRLAWAGCGTAVFVLALAGLRLDLRVGVLVLVWLAPDGLAALRELIVLPNAWVGRLVAGACAAVVVALALPGVRAWINAVLFGLSFL